MTEITEATQFLSETLVTDTRVWEIVKRTAKTLTLRSTVQGEVVRREDNGSPYPVVYTEALPDPDGRVKTVRLRKDGTYRTHASGRPLRAVQGQPTTRTDYSF